MPDVEAALAELSQANALQGEIWHRAVAACQESPNPLQTQLIPVLNEMFDLAATRMLVARIHPPPIIFALLGVLALMSSLLAGYAMAGGKARSWIHVIGFALITATTVYVILDLEFPRLGIIQVEAFDRVLVDLRQSMH